MSNDMEQQLVRALKEIEALKQENRSLKLQLSNDIDLEDPTPQTSPLSQVINEQERTSEGHVHLKSSSEEKIALFRLFFEGGEDVYPVLWVNKAGKSGYSPVCRNSGRLYAKSHKSNAQNAPIKHLPRCRMILLLGI